MTRQLQRTIWLFSAAVLLAGAAAASSSLWLHVEVDEGDGAKVKVNLPVSMVEKAVPLLPARAMDEARVAMGDTDVALADLRALWQEVKGSPDMTFVTVEDGDETVRVWKEGEWVFVAVRNEDGEEQVDVKLPTVVVDALLAGEELDLEGAVRALVTHGAGEFVTVRDREDRVRVWVDDVPEAK